MTALPGYRLTDASRGQVGKLVAKHASFEMQMRVPGGVVPTSGLTWVGVHPGHRRRGLLRAMVADHFSRSLARGSSRRPEPSRERDLGRGPHGPVPPARCRAGQPAVTRTDDAADLALDIRELSAAYLGGVSLVSLAGAGLVEEKTPGALTAVSRAFTADETAACVIDF